ncbi:hypothetical protein ACFJGW_15375 [Burkholderiaceae bacterium UC74_6]
MILQPDRSLDPPRSKAEIDEALAFFAEAIARVDNTPDDWLMLWERLQVSSDLRSANKEQWTLFRQYSKLAFVNAA